MHEMRFTVKMNALELKLFRRALAKAADDNLLNRGVALRRIGELDKLRWEEEDRFKKGQLVMGVMR